MDRLFIDTDVAIDFLLDRESFSADAARVFDLFERGQAEGFISALAMNNIHYIVRKVVGKEATKQILKQLIEKDRHYTANMLALIFSRFSGE